MRSLEPLPAFITEAPDADRGLICAFQMSATERPREIYGDAILESLARSDVVTWLHFNLTDARARRWLLAAAEFLPPAVRELLRELAADRRIEAVEGRLLQVMSDFTFEDDSDPWEVATLWCFVDAHFLITARLHPVKSTDDLRQQLRSGDGSASSMELLGRLLDLRSSRLRQLANTMSARLDDIEDEILAGNISQQREQLGRSRRLCARLRRQFAPERLDMAKFLHGPGAQLSETNRDLLRACIG